MDASVTRRDGFDHHKRSFRIDLVPQNPESMPQDSLTHIQLGIPDSTPPESALVMLYRSPPAVSRIIALAEMGTDLVR
jgi:hypothetical protein